MNWIETPGSSNIVRFAYESANSILVVEFLKGGIYNYFDVPEIVYEQMKAAESKGKFLAQSVKGVYRYARA